MQYLCTATAYIYWMSYSSALATGWLPGWEMSKQPSSRSKDRLQEKGRLCAMTSKIWAFVVISGNCNYPRAEVFTSATGAGDAEQPATALQHLTSCPWWGPRKKDHGAGEKGPLWTASNSSGEPSLTFSGKQSYHHHPQKWRNPAHLHRDFGAIHQYKSLWHGRRIMP